MSSKMKRFLAMALTVVMIVGMMPMNVFAAEVSTDVAKIGETGYATLAEALTAAQAGDTITILSDMSDVDDTISKDITLDLGGKTITDAWIRTTANVTIQNGSIKNTNEPYPLVVKGGELTIEDVAIEASKSDRAIWLDGAVTLDFNSGSILATKGENNTKSTIYGIWVSKDATANINGGSITVDAGADATAVAIFGNYTNTVNVTGGKISTSGKTYSYAIWVDGDVTVSGGEIVTNEKQYGYSSGITYGKNYAINSKGNVEISGGTITTNGPSGYLVNAGGSNQEVTISNVEFTNVLSEADKTAGGHSEPYLIYGSSVQAEITGGEFNGVNAQLIKGTGSALTVSGGSFSAIDEEYVEVGATVTVDGQEMTKTENGLEVVIPTYVAMIGEQGFATFMDALNYAIANGSSEIKVLSSVREVMPTDVEILLKNDLTITADQAVEVKFYNDGTNYDFIINSDTGVGEFTFTIDENVTFQLEDRVIWAGYYGNNVDVVVEGTLAGWQYWHGADTKVTDTGTLKSTGEAMVLRRGATLTVDGGTVNANYFSILSGNIDADNATITSGPIWVSNTGNYDNEGGVSIDLNGSTWTSTGNIKLASEKTAEIKLTNSKLSATGTEHGASVIDANSSISIGAGSDLGLKELTGAGTITIDATNLSAGETTIASDASGFTGNIQVTGNDDVVAEVVDGKITLVVNAYVAKIGETQYESLDAAIKAATAGQTITLIADITEDVTISKSLTIDGANFKYTGNISVSGGASDVTVKNVNFVDDSGYAITTNRINSITVENCTVKNYGTGFLYANKSTPTIVVKNVTVDGGSYGVRWLYGTSATLENVVMTNVVKGIETHNYGSKDITLKNCSISGTNPISIFERSGNSGKQTFKFEGVYDASILPTGTYANNVYGAKNGDKIGSLAAIVAAAKDGDTVTVTADHELVWDGETYVDGSLAAIVVVNGKAVTIDLNGHTLTGTADGMSKKLYAVFAADNGGCLTLKNGTVNITGTTAPYCMVMAYDAGDKVIIESGSYHMDAASDSLIFGGNRSNEAVYVKGGTFTLGNIDDVNGPWIFNIVGAGDSYANVTGGTFNFDINRQKWSSEVLVPETHYTVANTDGTWTVKEGAVAYVQTGMTTGGYYAPKNIGYATLAEAIEAAVKHNDPNVTLLKDVELDAPITVKNSINLDGNGKTITQSAECKNDIALLYFEGKSDAVMDVAVKNVTFDGLKTGAAIRALYANIDIDDVVFQNCEHTVGQGLVRLTYGNANITDSKFLNNNCAMAVSYNWDGAGLPTDILTVDNCEFTGNTANKTALIYYVKGAGCEIKNSEFVDNKVNTANNSAVIYLGFQDNCTVTGNLFKNNAVTDSSTSTRVAGAIFAGYQATITGNAFDGNTASNANGDVLGQVCISTYYEDGRINLSDNYWNGGAPVYGKDYTIQHQTGAGDYDMDSYYTAYTQDTNGNVVLSGEVENTFAAKIGTKKFVTLAEAMAAAKAGDTVTILAGNYTTDIAVNKAITVAGETDAEGNNLVNITGRVVASTGATVKNLNVHNEKTGKYDCALCVNGENIVIDGVKLTGYNAMRYCYATGDITIKNSTIDGSNFAVHFDGKAGGNIAFENCDITGWCSYASTVNSVSYTDCSIDQGDYAGHRYYNKNISFTDCDFAEDFQIELEASGSNVAITDADMTVAEAKALFKDPYYVAKGNVTLNNEKLTYVASAYTANGSKYFDSLQDAVDEVIGGGYINVLTDVTLTDTLEIKKPVTLGLNGKTITSTAKCAVEVSGGNADLKVVIESGFIVAASGNGTSALSVYDGADVTLDEVTLSGGYYGIKLAGYHGYPSDVNNNNLTSVVLDGGSVTAENAAIIGLGAYPNTQIDINGATVTSTDSIAIYHPSYGTLNITDGKVTGTTAIYMKAGNLNISGGEFVANGEKADYEYNYSGAAATGDAVVIESCNYGDYPTPVASITGGTFTSANNQAVATYKSDDAEAVAGFISGGIFNTPVAKTCCAEGYFPTDNGDGTYGVVNAVEAGYVAYSVETGKLYTKVSEAVMAATAGQTVRLLKNTEDIVVTVLDDVTLDLNGYELKANYVFCTGDLVDDSESNSGKLIPQSLMIRDDNRQLPIKDAEGAVKFFEIINIQDDTQENFDGDPNKLRYAFQPRFELAAFEALKAGQNVSGVSVLVRVTWTRDDGTMGSQDFVYNDSWVKGFLESYNATTDRYGKMFTLVLNDYKNYENLHCQVYITSTYSPQFTVASTVK